MDVGIVGLAYVGKTMLFNALTALGVESSTSTSATRPNIGVVNVPDPRLDILSQHIQTLKVVHATIQVVDVAGLVVGASKGEGMGNKFLAHIRNVDAMLHVVRCFDDPGVPHVDGSIDPVRDIEAVETELMLADLEQVEAMLAKARRQARIGDKQAKHRLEVLELCQAALAEGRPVSSLRGGVMDSHDAKQMLKSVALLTAKPVLYVANVSEDDLAGQGAYAQQLRRCAEQRSAVVVPVCAKLEAELVELEESERVGMFQAMGLSEPALDVLARAAYKRLGLHSFFTTGPKEIRAWAIPIGTTAPEAAGTIHTDLQRGFIRDEVFRVEDIQQYKSEQAIRAAGKLRVEGKNYMVQDGDVCRFLFNV